MYNLGLKPTRFIILDKDDRTENLQQAFEGNLPSTITKPTK